MDIRKYTNTNVEKYKCEKCERVWKESKCLYTKTIK